MKKNRFPIRLWWIALLLIISGFYLFSNLKTGTLRSKEIKFSISKAEKITKVSIQSQSSSISLVHTDEGWLVNNEVPAHAESINALLMALSGVVAASPIPVIVSDSLVDNLRVGGRLVRVHSGRRVIKEFYLQSTQTLGLETIGMLKRARNGYRLELPGYPGDFFNLFNTEIDYWCSKKLGIPNADEIIAVEVEMPQNPEQSYRIDIDPDEGYRFFALYQGVNAVHFDTLAVKKFVHYLSQISYKEKVTNISSQEEKTIGLMEPDFIFNIYLHQGTPLIIRIIPIPIEEHLDEFGRPIRFDLDRVYLTASNEPGIFEVAYIDLHPALRDIFYFNPKFQP